ncbi:MAG: O-antigen ligase family protein [Candidatus Binatia bacterium]
MLSLQLVYMLGGGKFALADLKLEAGLFYFLIFATVSFSPDFAHLNLRLLSESPYFCMGYPFSTDSPFATYSQIGGIPLHVTEIFIGFILGAMVVRRWRKKDAVFKRTPLDLWLGLWVLVGLFELFRGILSHGRVLLAARDFALVYYVIFFYLAREICSRWQDVHRLMVAFVAGTILRIGVADWYYVFDVNYRPDRWVDWSTFGRYMSAINGAYILIAVLIGVTLWQTVLQKRRGILFLYLSVAGISLVLTQSRSLLLALVIGMGVLAISVPVFGALKPLAFHRFVVGTLLAGSLLWLMRVGLGPSTPAPFLSPLRFLLTKSATTVRIKPGAAPDWTGTARFRHDAWLEAWRRFSANPVFGEGFGKKFEFYDTGQRRWWISDVRPHNTYLTILYKMGVTGLAVFMVIHLVFYLNVYRALRRAPSQSARSMRLGFAAAFLGFQVYGFFNLLLESPFLAVGYWSLMGVIFSLSCFGEVVDHADSRGTLTTAQELKI